MSDEVAQFLDIYLSSSDVPFEYVIYGNAADYKGLAHNLYSSLLAFNKGRRDPYFCHRCAYARLGSSYHEPYGEGEWSKNRTRNR